MLHRQFEAAKAERVRHHATRGRRAGRLLSEQIGDAVEGDASGGGFERGSKEYGDQGMDPLVAPRRG
jgi:hypothetical protein